MNRSGGGEEGGIVQNDEGRFRGNEQEYLRREKSLIRPSRKGQRREVRS